MRTHWILFSLVLSVECTTHFSGQTKNGIDFFLTGDYGNMEDEMALAQ